MRVQVVLAWPDRAESVDLDLPPGSRVIDAYHAAHLIAPEGERFAIFGKEVDAERMLVDGERIDLLRQLRFDPKLSRRQRVAAARQRRQAAP